MKYTVRMQSQAFLNPNNEPDIDLARIRARYTFDKYMNSVLESKLDYAEDGQKEKKKKLRKLFQETHPGKIFTLSFFNRFCLPGKAG